MVFKTDKSGIFLHYWRILHGCQDQPVPEYRFGAIAAGGPGKGLRKRLERVDLHDWRFDWAWPDIMVAVEVDGNAWNTKGGGRHGTDADRDKMNAAVSLGWRVFRFSPQQLENNPEKCCRMVMDALYD